MVGLNSFAALREFGKEPKRLSSLPTDPPPPDLSAPNFDDFSYQFNEPFPDFDSIDGWIIEPESVVVPMEEKVAHEPQLASSEETHQAFGVKNTRLDGPVPEKGEFRLYGLGDLRVEGPESKQGGEPQCSDGSDLLITEFQVSKVKLGPTDIEEGHPHVSSTTQLGIETSEKLGVSSISISEEMGKVSLVGASNAATADSKRVGQARIDEVAGEVKLKEGMNVDGTVVENITAVENAGERGETASVSDEVSKSSESEDSSSSSEEETDNDESEDDDGGVDDGDDDEKKAVRKMGDDGEVEEGEIRDFDQEDALLTSEDEEGGVLKGPIKSKNEIEEYPVVPPVNAVLQLYHQMLPVGVVLSIVGTKVIVEGLEKHNPLNEGSILWVTATRLPLGLVDEIFGPVKNPYYIVRFNSEEEVPAGICERTAISFVAEFANHVLNDSSLYKRGYDASGENDEEVSDVAEFSDDEKEAEYRRSLRMTKKGKDRSGNREFEGQKKAQLKNRYRNREFEGQKKAQIHKNIRPSSSPTPLVAGPPMQGMGMPFVPSHLQGPPVLGPAGCGSCGCSFGSGQVGFSGPACVSQASHSAAQATGLGGPPLHPGLQPNAGWVNGIPAPQQHMGILNFFQMNGMPHLPSMGGSNGLTGNEQFNPSHLPLPAMPSPCAQLGSMPMNMPMNLPHSNGLAGNQPYDSSQVPLPAIPSPCGPLGSMPMNLPEFVGNGSLNQVPFGMGIQGQGATAFQPLNRSCPSAPSQGGFPTPQKFNPRVATNRGRKPFPRGGRSNFSGRRGWRPTGQ